MSMGDSITGARASEKEHRMGTKARFAAQAGTRKPFSADLDPKWSFSSCVSPCLPGPLHLDGDVRQGPKAGK